MSSDASSAPAHRWWTLAVVALAQLMVVLDVTVINIALPRAQADLHFTAGNRQWIVTAYALSFGSLLLLGGRVSDLWGRRRALVAGLVGFAAASLVGGAADSFTGLVVARVAQGVFAALLAPAALAALSVTFTGARERAKAFAVYGVVSASGAAVGLLLGGALTQWASWRWCLDVNAVLAAVALVGTALVVEGDPGHRTRLDVLGTVLATGGIFCAVFGLNHAVTTNWSDAETWGPLVAAGALSSLFVMWQGRTRWPLLPLRIVTSRTRAGALTALLLTSVALFAVYLLLAYYLEETLGFSPLRAGVAFAPLVGAVALSATYASARLLARAGPRPLVPTGMLLAMMGMVLFTRLTPYSDYWDHVLPGLVLTGLGLGLILAPALATATSGVVARDAGAASAMVNTTQQIGGSLGTALLNTIAVTVTVRALGASTSATALRAATLHGYSVAFWWAAGFFGFGSLATLVLLRSAAPVADNEAAVRPAID
jgi:EmrB/QacA subfamily drug resistance transporter